MMLTLVERIAQAQRERTAQESTTKKIATKKSATKKSATKKSATKKSATKKSAVKKSAVKKSATKKSATKKSAVKKSALILDGSEVGPLIPPPCLTPQSETSQIPTLRGILDYLSMFISGTQNLELSYISLLGTIAGTATLALGPAGTGKSFTVNKLFELFFGRVGKCQINPFMERGELVGSIDMKKLDDGLITTRWESSPVNSHFLFLDEIDKGGESIQSTLLSVLNERVLYDNGSAIDLPIEGICCTANDESEMTEPMLDRFVLTSIMEYQEPSDFLDEYDALFGDDLNQSYALKYGSDYIPNISKECLEYWRGKQEEARASIRDARLKGVRDDLKKSLNFVARTLGGLSQRRTVQLVDLMAANAAICGRNYISASDFGVLAYASKDKDEQKAILSYLCSHQSLTKADKLGLNQIDGTSGIFGSPKHHDLIKSYLASIKSVREKFRIITEA